MRICISSAALKNITGWVLDNRHLFLTVLESRKYKIKVLEDLASGEGSFSHL